MKTLSKFWHYILLFIAIIFGATYLRKKEKNKIDNINKDINNKRKKIQDKNIEIETIKSEEKKKKEILKYLDYKLEKIYIKDKKIQNEYNKLKNKNLTYQETLELLKKIEDEI